MFNVIVLIISRVKTPKWSMLHTKRLADFRYLKNQLAEINRFSLQKYFFKTKKKN